MKLLLRLMVLAMMAVVTTSCGDDETEQDYYVRYVVSVKPGQTISIGYTAPGGTRYTGDIICGTGDWNVTVGPVKSGFEATITVSCQYPETTQYVAIEAGTGNGPLAQKEIVQKCVSMSYVVGK